MDFAHFSPCAARGADSACSRSKHYAPSSEGISLNIQVSSKCYREHMRNDWKKERHPPITMKRKKRKLAKASTEATKRHRMMLVKAVDACCWKKEAPGPVKVMLGQDRPSVVVCPTAGGPTCLFVKRLLSPPKSSPNPDPGAAQHHRHSTFSWSRACRNRKRVHCRRERRGLSVCRPRSLPHAQRQLSIWRCGRPRLLPLPRLVYPEWSREMRWRGCGSASKSE